MLEITTLAERPEYLERMYECAGAWPAFMHNDPIGNAFMGQIPVHVDVEHNHAVYVEPNVWICHDL